MAAPLFELKTELQSTNRRDFPVADSTILKPLSTNPLVEGEWLDLNASQKLERGLDSMSVYPVHTERGRYDTQAIGKANVLFFGQFEADTKVYKTDGAPVYNAGTPLKVVTLTTSDLLNKRGLAPATAGDIVVGYVTMPPANNNNKLRFMRVPPYKLA